MEHGPHLPPHRFLVHGLIFIGIVAAVVSSLGAPMIPKVAAVDHVSLSDAQWSLTIVFLMTAVATPLMGRLGDGPHRRTVILGGLGVVAAGGVLAALPLSFGFLLTGRALQGVGLGLTPMGMAAARAALPVERARSVVSMLSITTAAGIGLGYPITGLIVQHGNLHIAFWFATTIALLALIVASRVIPPSANQPRTHLDVAGAVMLGAALAGLLLAISQGNSWGWTSGRFVLLVIASLFVCAGWVVLELRRSYPLVELRMLTKISVLTADISAILSGIGTYLFMSLVTRFVQTPTTVSYGLGGSVTVAGLILVPFSVGTVVANRIAPTLIRQVSPYFVIPVGSIVMLASMIMFTYARASIWEIAIMAGISGIGIGIMFAAMPALIVRSVPSRETGSAMSFNQVLRYIGYGGGSSLCAVILQAHTARGHTLPSGNGYAVAGLIGCLIWIITAVVSLLLPRLRPDLTTSPLSADRADALLVNEVITKVPIHVEDSSIIATKVD